MATDRRRSMRLLKRRLQRLESPLSETLGEIIVTLDAAEQRVRHQSAKEPRSLIQAFRRSVDEAIAVAKLFSEGFGAARAQYQQGDNSKRKDKTLRLLASPQQGALATFRLFTLFAVAESELFTRGFADWWLTPNEIARFRRTATCRRYMRNLPNDPTLAKQQIINWLKPSAPTKAPTWPTRMRRVFRCRIESPLAETMVTLIMWRNEFSHLGRRRYKIEWNGTDLAECMIAWLFASIILSVRLGETSLKRLS